MPDIPPSPTRLPQSLCLLRTSALGDVTHVVPIIRTAVASDEVKRVLNEISARLTTADLVGLNAQVELQHQDADVATKAWLESHGYGM